QDVIVLPAFRDRGLGDRLMNAVMTWLDAQCPTNAFVALVAAPDKDGFYERYGFACLPADEPSMALRWNGPGCWRGGDRQDAGSPRGGGVGTRESRPAPGRAE
ncbi:MAG TPA: GNAT family N-acetyltransferase, partial [Thermoleophilia bacterium]|nr:GNAT family N-acetyltransferase [Thermoleophilia bacterium]